MADGSRHSMAYVEEVTYGTTPANPAFKYIRHNTTNIGLTKDAKMSAEIRSDRQISSLRHGMRKVAGAIPFELSYGSFDDLLAAVLCGSWVVDTPVVGTSQLKAGTTRRSYTIERYFSDIAGADKPYHRFTGIEFGGLSMSIKADALVTSELTVVGKDLSLGTAALAGATYANAYAVAVTQPFDSFTGTLKEGGTTIGIVTEVSLKLENGLNPRAVVGSNTTARPSIGRSNLTGSMTVFFENSTLLEKFLNETASSLEINLLDGAGNALTIKVPNIKYTGGQPDVGGEGPVTLSMPFQALLDSTTSTNFIFERNPV